MTRIRMVSSMLANDLESRVNAFLNSSTIKEVIDIKYQMTTTVIKDNQKSLYTAMIIYKT